MQTSNGFKRPNNKGDASVTCTLGYHRFLQAWYRMVDSQGACTFILQKIYYHTNCSIATVPNTFSLLKRIALNVGVPQIAELCKGRWGCLLVRGYCTIYNRPNVFGQFVFDPSFDPLEDEICSKVPSVKEPTVQLFFYLKSRVSPCSSFRCELL